MVRARASRQASKEPESHVKQQDGDRVEQNRGQPARRESLIKQKVQIYFEEKRAKGRQAKAAERTTRLDLKHGQSVLKILLAGPIRRLPDGWYEHGLAL